MPPSPGRTALASRYWAKAARSASSSSALTSAVTVSSTMSETVPLCTTRPLRTMATWVHVRSTSHRRWLDRKIVLPRSAKRPMI